MKIQEYLDSLGETEKEVINNLTKDGIRGRKLSTMDCPIIRGIRKNCSENPFVYSLRATAPGRLTWNDPQVLDPHCPDPVGGFMFNFDQGLYPDLEQKVVTQVIPAISPAAAKS